MKLIESPLNSNLNLETAFSSVSKALFDKKAINYYKVYALDSTHVVLIDSFDKITVAMNNRKRKIKHSEIELILHRLLKCGREDVTIDIDFKKELLSLNYKSVSKYKDVILIEKPIK